ncbi:MAG: hypothetical protein FD176_32 [Rhodospirillaceae bacterium]|nr:MAG: hypothetical protein FD176_32 [Rhodospirillaceae bacterium]
MDNPDHSTANTLEHISCTRPIGVFDSGIGGLTVAAALRRRLPAETLLYLGDVARLPYGTKAPQTIIQYVLRAATFFRSHDIKMLVLACNTASAHAAAALAQHFPDLLVPCRSGAFDRAITALSPTATVTPVPCPLFVALVEEGLTEGPIAEAMIRQYLSEPFQGDHAADCLVLGCTHFPLLAPSLRKVLGPAPVLVDCAEAVAERAALMLAQKGVAASTGKGGIHLYTTDAPARFSATAGAFFPGLGAAPPVDLIDL